MLPLSLLVVVMSRCIADDVVESIWGFFLRAGDSDLGRLLLITSD